MLDIWKTIWSQFFLLVWNDLISSQFFSEIVLIGSYFNEDLDCQTIFVVKTRLMRLLKRGPDRRLDNNRNNKAYFESQFETIAIQNTT